MFEKFSKNARSAVVQAQEEARALRHDRIDTGHLLLALLLLLLPESAPVRALRQTGIELDTLKRATLHEITATAA